MKPAVIALLLAMASFASGGSVNLDGKPAEEFDWSSYFKSGDHSTATEMMQAQEAVRVLKLRMEDLCTQYRDLMTKRGDLEAVQLFDRLQETWLTFAEAEVAFVGASWSGCTGQKAAIPRHRFVVSLRRVKELRDLESQSLFLNQSPEDTFPSNPPPSNSR